MSLPDRQTVRDACDQHAAAILEKVGMTCALLAEVVRFRAGLRDYTPSWAEATVRDWLFDHPEVVWVDQDGAWRLRGKAGTTDAFSHLRAKARILRDVQAQNIIKEIERHPTPKAAMAAIAAADGVSLSAVWQRLHRSGARLRGRERQVRKVSP